MVSGINYCKQQFIFHKYKFMHNQKRIVRLLSQEDPGVTQETRNNPGMYRTAGNSWGQE